MNTEHTKDHAVDSITIRYNANPATPFLSDVWLQTV